MSNLGTVYEINLSSGYKNVYPVVYRNKSKLYCKIYGCDDLEVVYAEDCPDNYNKRVVSLERFKQIALEDDKWYGWVFVPPHVDYWFPELKESAFNRRINDLKNRIKNLERNIEYCNGMIKKAEAKIIKYEQLRLKYMEEQSKKHDKV